MRRLFSIVATTLSLVAPAAAADAQKDRYCPAVEMGFEIEDKATLPYAFTLTTFDAEQQKMCVDYVGSQGYSISPSQICYNGITGRPLSVPSQYVLQTPDERKILKPGLTIAETKRRYENHFYLCGLH